MRIYETPRQCGRAGSSPSSGGKFASEWFDLRRDCRDDGGGCVVGETLVGGVEERRRRSPCRQTSPRPDTATRFLPETAIEENSLAWSSEVGLSHRLVDLCPRGGCHSEEVRCELSRRLCGTPVACAGLDLSEARAARPRSQRSEDCPLASACLASPKKRARGEKLASSSRMRVVSCCSPRGDEPGRHAAKRPCSMLGIVTIDSRQSARSPFRPTAGSSACTFASSSGTSARKTWWTACGNCTATRRSDHSGLGSLGSASQSNPPAVAKQPGLAARRVVATLRAGPQSDRAVLESLQTFRPRQLRTGRHQRTRTSRAEFVQRTTHKPKTPPLLLQDR